MIRFEIVNAFIAAAGAAKTTAELREAIIHAKSAMGFDYIAITHHANLRDGASRLIRIDDYPAAWVEQFDARRLGLSDPVHRASHVENRGFPWTAIERMVPMRATDQAIFASARDHDIGDGYTFPMHVPGETSGSVSFAMRVGKPLPGEMLVIAEVIASHAFGAARRLLRMRPPPRQLPLLTPTQQHCLRWVMLGKSDWETSRIMGCRPQTVKRHITQACERYDVDKRTWLMTLTLLDGTLSLADAHPY